MSTQAVFYNVELQKWLESMKQCPDVLGVAQEEEISLVVPVPSLEIVALHTFWVGTRTHTDIQQPNSRKYDQDIAMLFAPLSGVDAPKFVSYIYRNRSSARER